jgi:putative DNA primase/helicase
VALRFVERHAGDLRFVAAWGKWFRWIGHKWEEEKTLYAFDLAKRLCFEESARCNKRAAAKTLALAKTRAAVVSMAREDRRLVATSDQWDTDLWLLNTPGGTVDLHTGTLREHQLDDYCTKSTAVAPGGGCPRWMNFLETITAGDVTLQKYLQRILGYSLTGSIKEHALFFFHGLGGNGKSTLLNTVAAICADYHKTASVETFTVSMGERHPADLAALRGARIVTANETEDGQHWAESRIKQLTGGDPVNARFMRQDFFEYMPQFKLFFLGNHKPNLRTVNAAIIRRMHLVPFGVVLPPDKQDKDMADKLRNEWSGILAWMIEGCLAWQKEGLAPPDIVVRATDEYLAAEDTLSAWIEDCCVRDPHSHTSTRALFASWEMWAARAGYYPGSIKRLASKLDGKGFRGARLQQVRGYWGLRLGRQAPDDPEIPF